MKWVNHILIGSAITAVWKPELVPIAAIGSTAPDWLEWVSEAAGKPLKHRTTTHYLILWVIILIFGLNWDFNNIITAFGLGGLLHVLSDAMTIQGVPIGWWSDRRFHLFGGRLRTGRPGEYFVSFSIMLICFSIVILTSQSDNNKIFTPFFYNWMEFYNSGIVDGYEWRQNRWRWF